MMMDRNSLQGSSELLTWWKHSTQHRGHCDLAGCYLMHLRAHTPSHAVDYSLALQVHNWSKLVPLVDTSV